MKPCRNQNMPPHRPPVSGQSGGQSAPTPMAAAPVHRYTHPIRTARPAQRSAMEETLSYILETLSRQSDQLDELLRRTEQTAP
ncbi:MAG: hypothetical protein HFF81_09740 [Oscillospiraceae bacterium]|nr:hypothetical protein [Oscillospiraceae bacterium]